MQQLSPELDAPLVCDEARRVVLHRFTEARQAGLTRIEARLFAESTIDCGLLRRLVAGGCRPQMIARILL